MISPDYAHLAGKRDLLDAPPMSWRSIAASVGIMAAANYGLLMLATTDPAFARDVVLVVVGVMGVVGLVIWRMGK